MNILQKIEFDSEDIQIDIDQKAKKNNSAKELPKSNSSNLDKSYIFIKDGRRYERVHFIEIQYIKADGSYCKLHTERKSYLISTNLNHVMDQLKFRDIVRCHRSYSVNIRKIRAYDESAVYLENMEDHRIPMSTTYRANILKNLPKIHS